MHNMHWLRSMCECVCVHRLTKVDAILGEEDRAIDQVEPTTHHTCCGEGGTILLPRTRGAEHTAIICMEAIRVLLPALYVWVRTCVGSE